MYYFQTLSNTTNSLLAKSGNDRDATGRPYTRAASGTVSCIHNTWAGYGNVTGRHCTSQVGTGTEDSTPGQVKRT